MMATRKFTLLRIVLAVFVMTVRADYYGDLLNSEDVHQQIFDDLPDTHGVQKRLFTYPYIQPTLPVSVHRKPCPFMNQIATTPPPFQANVVTASPLTTTTTNTEEPAEYDTAGRPVTPKPNVFSILSSKFRALNGQSRHRLRPLRSFGLFGTMPEGARQRARRSLAMDGLMLQRRC